MKVLESNLTSALATTVTPLSPLARTDGSAPTTTVPSAEPATVGFLFGLWLRLGIIGMLTIAASLAAPLLGEASIGQSLVGLVAGGLLIVGAWRHTRSVFGEVGGDTSP